MHTIPGLLNLQVIDFINAEGEIKSYEEFQQSQGIPNLNFITYYGIVTAIPIQWKTYILENVANNLYTNTQDMSLEILNSTKVCKLIYQKLIDQSTNLSQINGLQKWKSYFNGDLTDDEWLLGIKKMYSLTEHTELSVQTFTFHCDIK